MFKHHPIITAASQANLSTYQDFTKWRKHQRVKEPRLSSLLRKKRVQNLPDMVNSRRICQKMGDQSEKQTTKQHEMITKKIQDTG